MKASEKCLDIIRESEGLRTKAYLCPANVWTIGYGHTRGVQPGDVITVEQANEMLRNDVEEFEAVVSRSVHPETTQSQFDALVSFTYNVGAKQFVNSTLLKKHNAKDVAGAAAEFGKWINAGGKPLPGLVTRRGKEKSLYLRNDS